MKFQQVIGQEAAKNKLRHAYNEGRIAHAIMFIGPEGNGALPLALAFAQYVSCPNRTALDSCGECPTCRKFSSLQHPDVFFTFPFFNKSDSGSEKTTCDDWMKQWRSFVLQTPYAGIDDWRDQLTKENKQLHISVYEASRIIQNLVLKSYEGGYKFQFIWMADYLKPDTANKLLKIIEEPPTKTIFLLMATGVQNILPTILSRVQSIYIPRMEDQDVVAALQLMNLPAAQAAEIAHFAHGDWNKALKLTKTESTEDFFANQFQSWIRNCYRRDLVWLYQWADKMHELPREELKAFLTYTLDQIRQNLVKNYTGDAIIRMNQGEMEFSQKFSPFINDLNAEDLMEVISTAVGDISRNTYSKLTLLYMSIKVFYLLRRQEA